MRHYKIADRPERYRGLVLVALHFLTYGLAWTVLGGGVSWFAVAFLFLLLWVSVVDLQSYEIPDLASGLLAVVGALWVVRHPELPRFDHLAGATIWPFLFLCVGWFHRLARGYHGLGLGDVKLMVGIGIWVGFADTIYVVLGAAFSGIAVLLMRRARRPVDAEGLSHSPIAFGPFLCLSAWVVWLNGS